MSTYILDIIDGNKNFSKLEKYAFTNLNILPKKGGRGGVGGGCGTRMILNFGGVWHKNDLDVKYTPVLLKPKVKSQN